MSDHPCRNEMVRLLLHILYAIKVSFLLWRRGKCAMLAWQHLTTANQRIKLAERVLSLL